MTREAEFFKRLGKPVVEVTITLLEDPEGQAWSRRVAVAELRNWADMLERDELGPRTTAGCARKAVQ